MCIRDSRVHIPVPARLPKQPRALCGPICAHACMCGSALCRVSRKLSRPFSCTGAAPCVRARCSTCLGSAEGWQSVDNHVKEPSASNFIQQIPASTERQRPPDTKVLEIIVNLTTVDVALTLLISKGENTSIQDKQRQRNVNGVQIHNDFQYFGVRGPLTFR